MKIYQEPASVATPGTGKMVSFAPTTPVTRRPLGARNIQPTDNNSTPMSDARLSKGQTPESSGHTRHAGKTPMKVSMSGTAMQQELQQADKENKANPNFLSQQAFSSSSISPSKTPTSAQALRRALRGKSNVEHSATIGQAATAKNMTRPIGKPSNRLVSFAPAAANSRRLAVAGTTTALGPPQRVAPKTPNSLLRTELSDESEVDESLLVSPPGALWSVLGATSLADGTPRQASSTSLIMVSPQAASAIYDITTSQKKKAKETFVSPVLQSTHLANSDDGRPKSVAMDLSSMFSSEKSKSSQNATIRKASPPRKLLQRLQKPTTKSKLGPPEKIRETNLPSPVELAKPKVLEKVTVDVAPIQRGSGVSMDMSSVFSQPTKSEVPQHLRRLQERPKNTEPTTPTKKSAHIGSSTRRIKRAVEIPEVPQVEPEKRGTGLSMDLSNFFCGEQQQLLTATKPVPPPHLLKRLQQRTFSKDKNQENDKENISSKPSKNASNSAAANLPINANKLSTSKKDRKMVPVRVAKQSISAVLKSAAISSDQKTKNMPASASTRISTVPNVRGNPQELSIKNVPISNTFRKAKPASLARKPAVQGLSNPLAPESKAPTHKLQSPLKPTRTADDWAGKQCDTFVAWLNYTFHPTEDENVSHTPNAGLKALVIHRRLAQVRYRAMELFQNDQMRRVRNVIQSEIARGRLAIRSDRDICADLSLREQATQLLLSYTTPWLRLGLEVMFGECIIPENFQVGVAQGQMSPMASMRATLRSFVLERVLSDNSVLIKYTKGKTNVPSGRFERLYREEMRTLVLYRLMVLVLFLDHAKAANILDRAPRLFTKRSEVKSSKAVLLAVCRDMLASEGDFIKHLFRIGIEVSYVQDPIDELEFNVTNLAADLRDGGRLTRLAEITSDSPFKSAMRSLRLPAVSRLQKMHNVNVAIAMFKDIGVFVPTDLSAHHIVDAHREMVLKLMWSVISHSCITNLLASGQVEQEIENVQRSTRARRKVQGLLAFRSPRQPCKQQFDSTKSPEQVLKSLLLQWCNAVCSHFGLELNDFTTSFADGKALCYLVHFYHPSVVRLDEILPTLNSETEVLTAHQILQNERSNSTLVARRVSDLGGIPNMLPIMDSGNPPDEKTMLLCLSYLCSRLTESSKEILATILIQTCYRRYQAKLLQEKKEAAAYIIYKHWCQHKENYYSNLQKRYAQAVAVLEEFIVSHKAGLVRLRHARLEREAKVAATIEIQRCFRGFLGRARFFVVWEREKAAIMIQQYTRRYFAQVQFAEILYRREAASSIQATWRGFLARQEYFAMSRAAVVLQRIVRGHIARCTQQYQHKAATIIQQAWRSWLDYVDSQMGATIIQSVWRRFLAQREAKSLGVQKAAATIVQKMWRGYRHAIVFAISREFAISIQKIARGYLVRKEIAFQHVQLSAIVLQKVWRGFSAQIQYHLTILDIVSIQSLARRKFARKLAQRRAEALLILQGSVRCALARRALFERITLRNERIQQTHGAVVCQCAVRMWLAKSKLRFRKLLFASAAVIQNQWRTFSCRRQFLKKKDAVTQIANIYRVKYYTRKFHQVIQGVERIQQVWRRYQNRKRRESSSTVIQTWWRGSICRHQFLLVSSEVLRIQKYWRAHMAIASYREARAAVVTLQGAWRRYSAMLNYELDVLEIVISQSVVRRRLAMNEALKRRRAVVLVQGLARCWFAQMRLKELRLSQVQYQKETCSAVTLQCFIRRRKAEKLLLQNVASALVIQKTYRAWTCRNHFQVVKSSVQAIQALYRGIQARSDLHYKIQGAVELQRLWRGYATRMRYELVCFDVTIAQAAVRRYLAALVASRRMASIVKLQSIVRMWRDAARVQSLRKHKQQAELAAYAATLIQATCRGSLVRQVLWWQLTQATIIQTNFRRYTAQVNFKLQRLNIIMAQCTVRQWLARRRTLQRRHATVAIQRMARFWIARHELNLRRWQKQQSDLENSAALIVQSTYRGYKTRQVLSTRHLSATIIQASFRGYCVYLRYQLFLVDVILVQSVVRRWKSQKTRKEAEHAVLKVQSAFRRASAVSAVARLRAKKEHLILLRVSTVRIQSVWRGFATRRVTAMQFAARKIQKTWRCFAAQVDFLVQQISIIKIQAVARRLLVRATFLKTKNAIVTLQAVVRGTQERATRRLMSMSASIIQANARGRCQRLRFVLLRRAAITIQSVVRRALVRDELEVAHFAATEIQRTWRGFVQFCDYVVSIDSVIRLQTWFRIQRAMQHFLHLKKERDIRNFLFNKCARKIQVAFRGLMRRQRMERAAETIQSLVRTYLTRRQATRVSRGVVRLQAVFRARRTRRRRTKRVLALAHRVKAANKKSRDNPKLRIGYKTRHALKILQTSKSLAEIMDAVKSLETSTRLSQLCCVLFTEANAAKILLDLIRSCNRSVPHVELVQCILLTLDNVVQYPQLVPSFADVASAEIFLDKMQMFRDKEGIFCLSINLLRHVAAVNPAVEDFCSMHEHLKRLKALHQLSLRRAHPNTAIKRDRTIVPNRMKRRDIFDRTYSIKTLGALVDAFENHRPAVSSSSEISQPRHFAF